MKMGDFNFGKLYRLSPPHERPRYFVLRINDRTHIFSAAELAQGDLDIGITSPPWSWQQSWRQQLRSLLRELHYNAGMSWTRMAK